MAPSVWQRLWLVIFVLLNRGGWWIVALQWSSSVSAAETADVPWNGNQYQRQQQQQRPPSPILSAAAAAAKGSSPLKKSKTTATPFKPAKKSPPSSKPFQPIITSRPTTTTTPICSAQDDFSFQSNILFTVLGRPRALTKADLQSLQKILLQGYQQVADCGGNTTSSPGAFLRLEQVNISTASLTTGGSGSSAAALGANISQSFTVFATVAGICRGCETFPFFIVQSDVLNNTTTRTSRFNPTRRRGLQQPQPPQYPPTTPIRSASSSSSSSTTAAAASGNTAAASTNKNKPAKAKQSLSSSSSGNHGAAAKKPGKVVTKKRPITLPPPPPPTRLPTAAPSSPPPTTPAVPCKCSLPFKAAWIQAVNALLVSQGQRRSASKKTTIERVVDATKLDAIACSPTETLFDTFLSVSFGEGSASTPPEAVAAQLQLIGEIIVDSYNDAAATTASCDPNFVTLVAAQVLVSPNTIGDGGSGRDLATTTTTNKTKTTTARATVFKVTAKCRGCPSKVKLFNDASGRRRRMMILGDSWRYDDGGSLEMNYETEPFLYDHFPSSNYLNPWSSQVLPRRRLPIIDNQCYCPANDTTSTTTRSLSTLTGRLSLSQFLQVLNQQITTLADAGLITIVGPVQGTSQQSPANCTDTFNNFTTTVTVVLTQVVGTFDTSLTVDEQQFLQVSFQNAYNLLTDGSYCDPFFRRITSVNLIRVETGGERRRVEDMNRQQRRQVQQSNDLIVVFACQGQCRGCPPGSGLFDSGTSSRRRRRDLEYTDDGANNSRYTTGFVQDREDIAESSNDAPMQTRPRSLQQQTPSNQTLPCLCSETSISNTAPSYGAFLVAYNATIGPTFALATGKANLTSSPTVSPSDEPTHSPSPPPTALPTASPSSPPTTVPTFRPTNVPVTATPTFIPTVTPSTRPTLPPTLSPTDTPSNQPSLPPTASPSASPTDLPNPNPVAPSNLTPTSTPVAPGPTLTVPPTSPPTRNPGNLPTLRPTGLPTTPPTSPPTQKPTSSPTSGPTAAPTILPTSDPSISPTASPTPPPTPDPTALRTAPPTSPPTRKPTTSPTTRPTALPTSQPTSDPSISPTAGPTAPPTQFPTEFPTTQPTSPPTSSPTIWPTASPTSQPTSEPTISPTTPPTPLPTAFPSTQPTLPPTSGPTLPPTLLPTSPPTDPPCQPPGAVCSVAQDCCSSCCGDDFRCGVYIAYYGGDITDGLTWKHTPSCFYGGCYGGGCGLTTPQPSSASCLNAGSPCSQDSDCCLNSCCNGQCGTYFWNFDCFYDPSGCVDTTQPSFVGSCAPLTCLPAASVCSSNAECCSGCCGLDNRCGVYIDYFGGDLNNGTWSSTPGCYSGNCYGGTCPVSSQQQPTSAITCVSTAMYCNDDAACCSGKCCGQTCGVFISSNTCFDYPKSCVDTRLPSSVGSCPPPAP